MMAKLVAISHYLVIRDDHEELIKLINFVCRPASGVKYSIRQKQPSDKNGGTDDNNDKSDKNKSRADHQRPQGGH